MSTAAAALVLAVDLGTSGPKVGLVTPAGDVVAWAFAETPVQMLPGGGVEQDPDDWWRAITVAARQVLETSGVPAASVAGVACTGQWSGTVPVGPDGRHLANALIWMDARGADLVKDLIAGPVRIQGYAPHKAARWIRLTGGGPEKSGKDPVGHILWLAANRPEVYGAATALLEPKDYLNLRLTGRAAAGSDSIALHWVTDNRDVDDVRYHDRLLDLTGLDPAKLPELRRPTDVLGPLLPEPAEQLGLAPGIPVVMGTPDLHSAAIGSGAVADFQPHLYLGTSSWLVCHVPFKKTDLMHNMASLPSALPGTWLLANEQEAAGGCLTYLAQRLQIRPDGLGPEAALDDIYRGYDRMAETSTPGSRGVIFGPWLHGERTPVEDSSVRGGFFNLSMEASSEDLVRAVLEGVAFNTRWLLRHVERFVGRRMDPIRIVGGGAQSDVWCQIHADVLQRTIQRSANPRLVNLRGVGRLAFFSLGALSRPDLATETVAFDTFYPQPGTRELYDAAFSAFMKLFRATRRTGRRLVRV